MKIAIVGAAYTGLAACRYLKQLGHHITVTTTKESRKNELESDKLGLVFVQLAGYDASKAIGFWQRMAANGQKSPEFLSTHPSDDKRVKEISTFLESDKFKNHIQK